jgi:hypothetical protein
MQCWILGSLIVSFLSTILCRCITKRAFVTSVVAGPSRLWRRNAHHVYRGIRQVGLTVVLSLGRDSWAVPRDILIQHFFLKHINLCCDWIPITRIWFRIHGDIKLEYFSVLLPARLIIFPRCRQEGGKPHTTTRKNNQRSRRQRGKFVRVVGKTPKKVRCCGL